MATIRTITDPRELVAAQLEEVHAGNETTRKEIRRLRSVLMGGVEEERRLQDALAEWKTSGGGEVQD